MIKIRRVLGKEGDEWEEFRQAEATRLLQWIRDNQSDWWLICNDDGELEDCELSRLLGEMTSRSFYQIAMVLLASCEKRAKGERALTATLIDMLLESTEQGGIVALMNRVASNYEA